MRIRGADDLLLAWVESLDAATSVPAFRYVSHTGLILRSSCSSVTCQGEPALHASGWRCSRCSKAWELDTVHLPRYPQGLRDNARSGRRPIVESRALVAAIDLGAIIGQIREAHPWPYRAWFLHVIGPGREEVRRTAHGNALPTLGIAQDQIPAELQGLVDTGRLPAPPHPLTEYRVRSWIREARIGTLRAYQRATTLARLDGG